MSAAERRKLVEAPITINVIGPSKTHGGVNVRDPQGPDGFGRGHGPYSDEGWDISRMLEGVTYGTGQ